MSLTPRIDKLDKNYIINGGYDYSQRALTASLGAINTPAYISLDRFITDHTEVLTSGTFDRVIDSPNSLTKYCGKFTINTATSTNVIKKGQRIESIFSRDLVSKETSYSLYYKTDSCQQINFKIFTADIEDDFTAKTLAYSKTIIITADNVWHRLDVDGIPAIAGVERGCEVSIEASNWGTLNANTSISFAQDKFSISRVAQDFSYSGRDAVEELGLCQRYYEVNSVRRIGSNGGGFTGNAYTNWTFVTEKRTIPIASLVASTGAISDVGTQGVTIFQGNTYPQVGVGSNANAEL